MYSMQLSWMTRWWSTYSSTGRRSRAAPRSEAPPPCRVAASFNRVSPAFAIVAILLLSLLTRQRPTFSPAEQLAASPTDPDEADDLNDLHRALRTCPACGQGLLRACPLPSTLVPSPPAPIHTS